VHHSAGWLYLDQNDQRTAWTAFTTAIELGGRTWSYVLRGLSSLRTGDLDSSLHDLTLATRRLPNSIPAASFLARAHRRLGDPGRALDVLSSVAAGPADDWWRYQTGLSLAETGTPDEAAAYFADAVELGRVPATRATSSREGDPNLGLYLLAAGREQDAVEEFGRLVAVGTWRAIARELADDLVELAAALPERARAAERCTEVILCR
jgi:tetratricopeptide (TPR) repeat protein